MTGRRKLVWLETTRPLAGGQHVGDHRVDAAVDEPERLLERVGDGYPRAHLVSVRSRFPGQLMSIRSAHHSTRLGAEDAVASSATAFDRLAPDQRAAVELVLRQGRSYGELADLLGMPEETIRTRARNGLAGLAPDLLPPARSGEIADWLLGQQSRPTRRARARCCWPTRPRKAGRRRSPSRCARSRAARPSRRSRPAPDAAAGEREDARPRRPGRRRRGAPTGAQRRAASAAPRADAAPRPPPRPTPRTRARRRRRPAAAAPPPTAPRPRPPARSLLAARRRAAHRRRGRPRRGRARVRLHARRRRAGDRAPDAAAATATPPPPPRPRTTSCCAGPAGSTAVGPDAALPGQRRHGPVRDRRAGRRAERRPVRRTRSGSRARTARRACSATSRTRRRERRAHLGRPGQRRHRRVPDWLQTYERSS